MTEKFYIMPLILVILLAHVVRFVLRCRTLLKMSRLLCYFYKMLLSYAKFRKKRRGQLDNVSDSRLLCSISFWYGIRVYNEINNN